MQQKMEENKLSIKRREMQQLRLFVKNPFKVLLSYKKAPKFLNNFKILIKK